MSPLRELLEQVCEGQFLNRDQAQQALHAMIDPSTAPELTGALLGALRARQASATEIEGFARGLRGHSLQVNIPGMSLDTCGTGGDGGNTFNVSTAVALLVASLGVPVVKHGNRAVSSQSGSADVLEALGISLQQSPESVQAAVADHQFGFCFAPAFHPAMKAVAGIRRNLGVRTVFNLLGPLCNPAQVTHQILGVYDPALTELMAQVLNHLGLKSALVVSSLDGLDELSLAGPTQVTELRNKTLRTYQISPEDAGLCTQSLSGTEGGTPADNALILQKIFQGETGPCRDLVLYNAAAALWIVDRVDNLSAGVDLAVQALDDGRVLDLIERLQTV